jgi:hypothetical protein
MATDQEMLEALDQIENILTAPEPVGIPDISVRCRQYKRIRPMLEGIIPALGQIPVYGKQIVLVIRFLIQIADLVCSGVDP